MSDELQVTDAADFKILIVEDDRLNREMLERIIRRAGFQVATAADGAEGLERFREFGPDIIISDIKMPGMTGLEMTRIIRQTDRRVHIIAFTAFNELDLLHQALRYGINHYLVKPFDADLFFSVLDQSLTEIRRREQSEERIRLMQNAIENSGSLIAIYDDTFRLTYANPALFKITGRTPEALIGQTIETIFQHTDGSPILSLETLRGELDANKNWSGILPVRHDEAEEQWIAASIAVVEEDSRTPRYFVNVGEDITKRLRYEEQLERRDTILKATSDVISCFLNQSHWRQNLQTVLRNLARATDSARLCLYQMTGRQPMSFTIVEEWFDPTYAALAEVSLSQHIRWDGDSSAAIEEELLKGRVVVRSAGTMPESIREFLEKHHIRNLCLVPILTGSSFWGFLCFNAPQEAREWSDMEREALLSFARIIGAAISHASTAQELHHNKDQLERIVDSAQLGIWEWYAGDREMSFNALFAELHGLDPTLPATSVQDIFHHGHPDDRHRIFKQLSTLIRHPDGGTFNLQYRMLRGGEYQWVESVGDVTKLDNKRRPVQVSGISYDIDERKRIEEKLLQTAKIFTYTSEAISITDADKKIIDVNSAFESITGYTKQETVNQSHSLLKSGTMSPAFYEKMHETLRKKGVWQGEITNRKKSGELFPAWLTISTIKDLNGVITNYVGVFSDISRLKEQQSRVEYLAGHDDLTGLPNRTTLMSVLEHSLRQAARRDGVLALLFLDLDGFKYINDTFGHTVGDGLLVEFAQRIRNTLRNEDFVCRIGGDEFIVLIDDDTSVEHIRHVTHKVLNLFSEPFRIDWHEFRLTASIGVSIFPDDASDVDTIIRHADIAMYQAKEDGKNTYKIYESPMGEEVSQYLRMQNDLQKALEENQFELHYQPQYDLATGTMSGLECLVRWQHPERGLISPMEFIPLAEETRQIIPLGQRIFSEACSFVKSLIDRNLFKGKLAVNVSTVQLEEAELFLDRILMSLEASGLPAEYLELEVTETFVMKNPNRSYDILKKIHDLGVTIALDDFGTGYSSLNQLNKYPIDLIKIDKSFIDDIPENRDDVVLTRTIIALAKHLEIPVLAEGVETAVQADFLKNEGCDYVQGYFYSRPLNRYALTDLLEASSSSSS